MIINGKTVMVVDTEDDSKGRVYHIVFYDGRTFREFDHPDTAVAFLESYKGRRVICFAVNLEYDVLNLFRGRYAALRWTFGRSRLMSVQFKRFLFYDTLNHWKMSVEQMGRYVGLAKGRFDPKNVEYCRQDCRVTFAFVKEQVRIYRSIGFPMKATLPSTVYHYWLNTYAPFRLRPLPMDLLDTFRLGYYGGRTDCFFIGELRGAVRVVDVNSLYPSVMLRSYPNPYAYERRYSLDQHGLTHARVRVRQVVPVLPYRTGTGKLIYPNGVFQGWWANPELRYAMAVGGCEIEAVLDSFTFPVECYPFEGFIQAFYERRMKAKEPMWNLTYKMAMNSLYGKFGQGKEKTHIIPMREYVKRKEKLGTDKIYIYDDIVIYVTEGRYPINTNMIWAIYTTAYGRMVLHEGIRTIQEAGGRVLYCDTDSIFYESQAPLLPTDGALGGWKDEGMYQGISIKLPKMYQLRGAQTVTKAKGVPKRVQETFFAEGSATFLRPNKFKESLRRGLIPNLWMETTKHNERGYDKGAVGRDGVVTPFTINIRK